MRIRCRRCKYSKLVRIHDGVILVCDNENSPVFGSQICGGFHACKLIKEE